MCDRSDYTPLQEKLEQLIQSYTVYYRFYGNVQTIGYAGIKSKRCD